MYYQIKNKNEYSSTSSFKSTPRNSIKQHENSMPDHKCELVKGLSSTYGRKLSSFYVIDEELYEMPFFNFEEKKIINKLKQDFRNKNVSDERSQIFWKQISQSVLTPYLPSNRILLNKFITNKKTKESITPLMKPNTIHRKTKFKENFEYFMKNKLEKHGKNSLSFNFSRSIAQNIKKNLEYFDSNKKFIKKSSSIINKSFENVKNTSIFGDFQHEFRRNSCYNSLEGIMTAKQNKFYKIFIKQKPKTASSCGNQEEVIEKKQIFSKKEINSRKNSDKRTKFTVLSIFKNKTHEKKLNYLLLNNNKQSSDGESLKDILDYKEPLKTTNSISFKELSDNQMKNFCSKDDEKSDNEKEKEIIKENNINNDKTINIIGDSKEIVDNSSNKIEMLNDEAMKNNEISDNKSKAKEEKKENRVKLNIKKSTFYLPNSDKDRDFLKILSARKTMPNLPPLSQEIQSFEKKNSQMTEDFMKETQEINFNFAENQNQREKNSNEQKISKEFKKTINKINGNHEENKRFNNGNNKTDNFWTDSRDLNRLKYLKNKIISDEFNKNKFSKKKDKNNNNFQLEKTKNSDRTHYKSKLSIQNSQNNEKKFFNLSHFHKKSRELIKNLEEQAKILIYDGKIPDRSKIKSSNQVVNDLYGISMSKNQKLPELLKHMH